MAFSTAAALISGPSADAGSRGSPAVSVRALAAKRSRNSSYSGASTMILRAFMQICPWWKKAANAAVSTALSTLASASTIIGLKPPSSSTIFLMWWAARSARWRPTAVDPVKLMPRTSGRSKNSSASGTAPPAGWVSTLQTPAGKPASSRISAITSPAATGASSDGFSTTVLPQASGGATVRQARLKAPFHGVKPAITPSGCLKA